MNAPLSRLQRRRLVRLADKIDRLIEADRRFFKRRSDRTCRVRRAHVAEIEAESIVQGAPITARAGNALFTVTRQAAPGVRLRALVQGPAGADPDCFGDEECRRIFVAATGTTADGIERAIVDTLRVGARQ